MTKRIENGFSELIEAFTIFSKYHPKDESFVIKSDGDFLILNVDDPKPPHEMSVDDARRLNELDWYFDGYGYFWKLEV